MGTAGVAISAENAVVLASFDDGRHHEKMLIRKLREMERDGIVRQHDLQEVPPAGRVFNDGVRPNARSSRSAPTRLGAARTSAGWKSLAAQRATLEPADVGSTSDALPPNARNCQTGRDGCVQTVRVTGLGGMGA